MPLRDNTLVEEYTYQGVPFYVKREDLACEAPGPPFAKIRGLLPHLQALRADGVSYVGYMDTAISMAGWGISYVCRELDMHAVIYHPYYKDGPRHNQKEYIQRWKDFGATIVPIHRPTKLQININIARREFMHNYPQGEWLDNGLKLVETVGAVEKEAKETLKQIQPASIVLSVGSGVMMAGVLRGAIQEGASVRMLIGVIVNKYADGRKKLQDIYRYANVYNDLFTPIPFDIPLINAGYAYEEKVESSAAFPCNPYYDAKAYEWMLQNIHKLPTPILYWNIGG